MSPQRPYRGRLHLTIRPSPLNEYEQLVEDVKGHALTLHLLGSYLRDAHDGDIRCRDRIQLEEADAEEQGGHAFRVLDAYVSSFERGTANDTPQQREAAKRALAILQLLGLFDRPATADCLEALWTGDVIPDLTEPLICISDEQRRVALQRLEAGRLITINREKSSNRLASVDSHPLIREYFAMRLKEYKHEAQASESESESAAEDVTHSLARRACMTSEVWRAAHRRLYEHLCETTNEGDQPTLEDLQPLYQAVAHGCHAGLQQKACDDVYERRICRGEEYYAGYTLGAVADDLAAVTCFFDTLWTHPHSKLPDKRQLWLLNEAGSQLLASGRLTEAVSPMRAAVARAVALKESQFASRVANNVSEAEMKLGNIADAVGIAQDSVNFADASERDFWGKFLSSLSRAHLGDALHAAGDCESAETQFVEAERLQQLRQPEYSQLCSVQGFWWCDLLLHNCERIAWWETLHGLRSQIAARDVSVPDVVALCQSTSDRAATSKRIAEDNRWILDSALDQLTLARTSLYAAIIEDGRAPDADALLDDAIQRIRVADVSYFPQGLLTRAWQRSLLGRTTGPNSAQSDLDEAWEIASRGPMPLFLADIHLHRARLFGFPRSYARQSLDGPPSGDSSYPWKSVEHDLAEARRLIVKHGYGRRLPELEDAEAALLHNSPDQ